MTKSKPILICPQVAGNWTMEESGSCRTYTGYFTIYADGGARCQVAGRIREWSGLPPDVYVKDPPVALRRHQHGSCLQLIDPATGWFKMHWEKPPKSFDAARAYIEQMLSEVIDVT